MALRSPFAELAVGCALAASVLAAAPGGAAPAAWQRPELASARSVQLGGEAGEALQRGVTRLAKPPYSAPWLRADISFELERIFTNYSGDVSGRFLELASLTSPAGRRVPATLDAVVDAALRYQKPDGHYGVDVDLGKPLTRGSPPIPMLWGNARLLVGLVTAAHELREPRLLQAARRLGDFYVSGAAKLCDPAREAEYRASGTGGDGYTCCYFPAMEGLVMLYRATHDARYRQQAERMAALFLGFDALPIDHSHGNLCAWRGILDLYQVTGRRDYLRRACAKWDQAVRGGYVWPVGGVGEHWYVSFSGDEGCSESDWLRFNLDLWSCTGDTRYLDMAERLLENEYAANQCGSGGYGWRALESDAEGPYATRGRVQEWNFCCSFHGPLGLHFLKRYLATGGASGITVNFPLTFTAPVRAGGVPWRVAARTERDWARGLVTTTLDVAPGAGRRARAVPLRIRVPAWAAGVTVAAPGASPRPVRAQAGYAVLHSGLSRRSRLVVRFAAPLRVEGRRFRPARPATGSASVLRDVSLTVGPRVLFATPAAGPGRPVLLATTDAGGRVRLFRDARGGLASVALPGATPGRRDLNQALADEPPVCLQPWATGLYRRTAFACDLLVVPEAWITPAARARLAARARPVAAQAPVYGANLEKRPDAWEAPSGWTFAADALAVSGGDVGLLGGEGYRNYRLEFDLTLPVDGGGIAGWVVRAPDEGNGVMFQIQSADSPYSAPEFKTRPNTLRPHVRRDGAWTVLDPVPLPREVRRGETHHVAVECRGERVAVYLDGERIHEQADAGFHAGSVGFRATGPAEAGIFRRIALTPLP